MSDKLHEEGVKDRMTIAEAREAGLIPPKHSEAVTPRNEADIQRGVESWLTLRGYYRLTAGAAKAAHCEDANPQRGWFGHWVNNRRNPLMPDVAVFSADMRRCLMIELKAHKRYQDGQREMIDLGAWVECDTVEDAEMRVMEWEKE